MRLICCVNPHGGYDSDTWHQGQRVPLRPFNFPDSGWGTQTSNANFQLLPRSRGRNLKCKGVFLGHVSQMWPPRCFGQTLIQLIKSVSVFKVMIKTKLFSGKKLSHCLIAISNDVSISPNNTPHHKLILILKDKVFAT